MDLLSPPKGCSFAPRCDSCMKVCLRRKPDRIDFSDIHYSRCFLRMKEAMEKKQEEAL
ncbi:MAG: hypothetical protein IJT16_05120 [Lachnospiraceae bacterium]|nr:hypothetical protein [Lachnospiraceae bacterium]